MRLPVPQLLYDGFRVDTGGDGLQDQVFDAILGLHTMKNILDHTMTRALKITLEGGGMGAGGTGWG